MTRSTTLPALLFAGTALLAALVVVAPARAQVDGDAVTVGAAASTPERRDALRWLERLERDLAELRDDARRAHWRPVADALIAAGDARGALLVARAAPDDAFADWLRDAVDARVDADDASAVVALAHLLERFDAPDPAAARRERVRALCLVGRVDWARRAAEGTTGLLAAAEGWRLEGLARRGPDLDARIAALDELTERDPAAAATAARRVFDAALDAEAVDAALDLLAAHGARPEFDGARGAAAVRLWDLGRRAEAIELVDLVRSGDARAAETLAAARDVPSSVLAPLFESLGRRDVVGRERLGRSLAHAFAREGNGAAAWERATALTTLGVHARFLLARDLERGGDTRHATLLATSDRWSAALLETWRAHRDGRGDEEALERARLLAGEGTERALALADLLLELGRDATAAEVVTAALEGAPTGRASSELEALAQRALAADGGRRLTAVHDGLESPAARSVLAAACVRAALERARR